MVSTPYTTSYFILVTNIRIIDLLVRSRSYFRNFFTDIKNWHKTQITELTADHTKLREEQQQIRKEQQNQRAELEQTRILLSEVLIFSRALIQDIKESGSQTHEVSIIGHNNDMIQLLILHLADIQYITRGNTPKIRRNKTRS